MITLYRVFLVFLIALSAYMLPEAMSLPQDSQYTIGPGFLPIIMLSVIVVCCIALLIFDFIKKNSAGVKKDAYIRLILYIVSTALLAICMEKIGIAISVLVYLFCIAYFVEKHPLLSCIKVSVTTTVLVYLIFHTWLGVPMTICNFL